MTSLLLIISLIPGAMASALILYGIEFFTFKVVFMLQLKVEASTHCAGPTF